MEIRLLMYQYLDLSRGLLLMRLEIIYMAEIYQRFDVSGFNESNFGRKKTLTEMIALKGRMS